MPTDHAAYSILLVQVALARYLGIRPSDVRARHRLREDLGIDAFDVALVAVALGDQLGVEVRLDDVDDAATVAALARCIAQVMESSVVRGDDVSSVRDEEDQIEIESDANSVRPDCTMAR